MFLVDTSVWLEILLQQEDHERARRFLERAPPGSLFVTEFTLYSVGLILGHEGDPGTYATFLRETVEEGSVARVRLSLANLSRIPDVMERQDLDFDDAYQHLAARQADADVVSFDDDFDATPEGRRSPEEALADLESDGA